MGPSFPALNLNKKLKRVEGQTHFHQEVALAIFIDKQLNSKMGAHTDIHFVMMEAKQSPQDQVHPWPGWKGQGNKTFFYKALTTTKLPRS
jgi:hypothetical protein